MEKRTIKNIIFFNSILVLGVCTYKLVKRNKTKEIKRSYTNLNSIQKEEEQPIVRTYTKLKRND